MPKNQTVEAKTEVFTESGILLNPELAYADKVVVNGEGNITFSMYCAARSIPIQQQAGRRAFTKVTEATLATWDAIFKRY